jgi:hypothetical protein
MKEGRLRAGLFCLKRFACAGRGGEIPDFQESSSFDPTHKLSSGRTGLPK